MSEPARKRKRYVEEEALDDDEQAMDDAVYQEWKHKIHPTILALLFRAGFRTHGSLKKLTPTDLDAAAAYTGDKISPGMMGIWNDYIADAPEDLCPHDNFQKPLFDPNLDRGGLPILQEHHYRMDVIWEDIRNSLRYRSLGDAINGPFEFARKKWQLEIYPRGKSQFNCPNSFAFGLRLLPQGTRKASVPVNYVIDIHNEDGLSVWDGESLCNFMIDRANYSRGNFNGFFFTKEEIEEGELKECRGVLIFHLFMHLHDNGPAAANWGAPVAEEGD